MPEARVARQKDRCPWQRLALVTFIIGIICTGREDSTCAFLSSHPFSYVLAEFDCRLNRSCARASLIKLGSTRRVRMTK
jgi:hypothetical protein